MMKRRHFLTTLGAATLASCGKTVDSGGGRLRVLASFLPLQSHTAAVAGGLVTVEQLLTRDAGPHDFQFSPADVRKLTQADLFVVNGVGLESWLDELVAKAASPTLVVVDSSAGLQLLPNPPSLDTHTKTTPGQNPHTWLDPILAQQQVKTILAALCQLDPANSERFRENAVTYLVQLIALDADFHAILDPLPNKNLVTFHDAFPYLATRYGLHYVGCVSEFPEKDPLPHQLAKLIESIKASKAGVIFAETGYAPGLLIEIARQTGTRVSQLDTLEIGVGHPTAYLDRMRQNLALLQAAFSGA